MPQKGGAQKENSKKSRIYSITLLCKNAIAPEYTETTGLEGYTLFSYHVTISIYIFAAVCALVVLFMSIYVRKAPKSLYFSYMSLAIFIFNTGYLFEITSTSEFDAIVATKVEYLGTCFICPFLLLFVLEYCGRRPQKPLVAALMVIPSITFMLVLLWPLTNAYYQNVVFVTDMAVPYLRVTGAAFYYVFHLYMYTLAVTAMIVVFKFYKKSKASIKKQSITVVAGIIISVVGNIINVFKISFWVLDLTPIVLSITCILLGYSIFRQGLYKIVPIAREQIVESMREGFILVDMQGHFLDANSAAMNLFPLLSQTSAGTRLDEIEGLAWLGNVPEHSDFSVEDPMTGEFSHYRISKTNIFFKQQELCNCYTIFDMTDTKQLLNKVSDLAERDSLTGLVHRGTFYDKGWSSLQSAGGACLLMLDLDHFKSVNDQYGHLKGDEVLKSTAATLSSCLRSTDLLARYGGEEFCALLPALDMEEALEVAERIRKRVAVCSFRSKKGAFSVTISIGVAMYDGERHTSFEELVADADTALYAAKNGGRNAVMPAAACRAKCV